MRRPLSHVLAAIQFLTRLPVPAFAWRPDHLARAMAFFPLVGAGVGAAGALIWLATAPILPPLVAALLALGGMLWLTGALHEDGLADTADALGGHASRDKVLEIMRDSRIGTYGAAALIVVLGLRVTALAALPLVEGALALIVSACIARAVMVPATRLVRYAREAGAGSPLADGPTRAEMAVALLTSLAIVLLLGLPGIVAMAVAATVAGLVLWRVVRRIGGYTGDSLGAMAALAEMVSMVTLSGLLSAPAGSP